MNSKRKPARASTAKAKPAPARPAGAGGSVDEVLATLRRMGRQTVRDGMARYGIPSDNAVGIPVGAIRELGKRLGRSHELALALWDSGMYEARLLAAFVDEPERITPAQMDAWRRDFDSWAVCDTVCFHLFDRTAHAMKKVEQWGRQAEKRNEFARRTPFALLACLALHDRTAPDAAFLRFLPLIEAGASDERNFVKKAVSWALRAIGGRSPELNAAAVALAQRLAASEDAIERWVGKDALRDITRPLLLNRLRAKATAPVKKRAR